VALIQTQAIIVTFLASGAAMLLAWVPRGNMDFGHAALLCASSLTTASLASFVLSGIMIVVVLVSRRYYVNPDNVATPIAASLGDLTTLAILSVFGSLFLSAHKTESWLNSGVIVLFIIALPVWIVIASRDNSTYGILRNGWSPIIFSMLISSSGGFVLETAMRSFPQMALFQPVINGVGGNLAAVHASRLSTFFHKTATLGTLPFSWTIDRFYSAGRAFFSNGILTVWNNLFTQFSDWDARSARVLMFLVVPGHMFFNFLITILHTGDNPPNSALFTSLYVLAALTQVNLLRNSKGSSGFKFDCIGPWAKDLKEDTISFKNSSGFYSVSDFLKLPTLCYHRISPESIITEFLKCTYVYRSSMTTLKTSFAFVL
jgi:solute carrier family 41